MHGYNATKIPKATWNEKERKKDFKRNQKTNPKEEARDEPLLLFKRPRRSINRTIGEPINCS